MDSISNSSLTPGLMSGQNALTDPQAAGYERQQTLTARERLDTGLTIQTREGDVVTLTSSSYSRMDAFMYDSRGSLYTDTGRALVHQSVREITLVSGESFTFSVKGDLSEQELKDIEAVVKGIDEVIARMKAGEMGEAVEAALSMGGYETVSGYAADISLHRSRTMASSMTTTTGTPAAIPEYPAVPGTSSFSDPDDLAPWLSEMLDPVNRLGEKPRSRIQEPIDQLFRHHLKKMEPNHGQDHSLYNILENARRRLGHLMEKL